jgi:heat shock protein HslJ
MRPFSHAVLHTAAICALGSSLLGAGDKVPPHRAGPADIEGRTWQISNYFVGDSQRWPSRALWQKGEPYIKFENGMVEGSPGCGRFGGKYRRLADRFFVSAEWKEDEKKVCRTEAKRDARQILNALANVRRIDREPEYWDSDALLLQNNKGATQITLSPMQAGKDLSELQDTFWRLRELKGSHADFAGVVINIGVGSITFSTRSCVTSYPFRYKLAGLKFFPAYGRGIDKGQPEFPQQEKIATAFEMVVLHEVDSYELSQDRMAFSSRDGTPVMVLASFPQSGIENRRWRIAKYRSDGAGLINEGHLIEAQHDADITFLNGRLEGSPGCGAWVGKYTLSGDKLTVQAGIALAGLCGQEEWVQGQLVVNAFRDELRIEDKGQQVGLLDKNGRTKILLAPY